MTKKSKQKGRLTVIAGPMFAGKTTKLITLYRVFKQTGNKVLCFKAEGGEVKNFIGSTDSHDARSLKVAFVDKKKPESILQVVKRKRAKKILIDAIHFFPEKKTKKVLDELLRNGIDVVVNGLFYDYKKRRFPLVHDLFNLADERTELFSVCEKCGAKAKHTEKVAGGKSTLESTQTAQYIPVCSACHKIYKG